VLESYFSHEKSLDYEGEQKREEGVSGREGVGECGVGNIKGANRGKTVRSRREGDSFVGHRVMGRLMLEKWETIELNGSFKTMGQGEDRAA